VFRVLCHKRLSEHQTYQSHTSNAWSSLSSYSYTNITQKRRINDKKHLKGVKIDRMESGKYGKPVNINKYVKYIVFPFTYTLIYMF